MKSGSLQIHQEQLYHDKELRFDIPYLPPSFSASSPLTVIFLFNSIVHISVSSTEWRHLYNKTVSGDTVGDVSTEQVSLVDVRKVHVLPSTTVRKNRQTSEN